MIDSGIIARLTLRFKKDAVDFAVKKLEKKMADGSFKNADNKYGVEAYLESICDGYGIADGDIVHFVNEKIKNLIDETFGDVEMLSPDFENLSGISKTQFEKKGKSFAAIEHFSNKQESEIPERLVKIVKKIYC